MEIVIPDLNGVTPCTPCDQGAEHPESHAPETRVLLADRVPSDMPTDCAIVGLVHAVRAGLKIGGPITVHKQPYDDIDASGNIVREWVATQP
jgi:hypothetical protein